MRRNGGCSWSETSSSQIRRISSLYRDMGTPRRQSSARMPPSTDCRTGPPTIWNCPMVSALPCAGAVTILANQRDSSLRRQPRQLQVCGRALREQEPPVPRCRFPRIPDSSRLRATDTHANATFDACCRVLSLVRLPLAVSFLSDVDQLCVPLIN